MHEWGWGAYPVDVVIWYLYSQKMPFSKFWVDEIKFHHCCPPGNFFSATPWKNHYFPNPWKNPSGALLVCAVIIISLRLSRLSQCNVNHCCKWDIIRFSWTFSSKNPVCAKILQWMVCCHLLVWRWMLGSPQTGCGQRTAPICKWCEHAIVE